MGPFDGIISSSLVIQEGILAAGREWRYEFQCAIVFILVLIALAESERESFPAAFLRFLSLSLNCYIVTVLIGLPEAIPLS